MNKQEVGACVGQVFTIRGARHLCVAVGKDALLLLQICGADEHLLKKGEPVQYIVAAQPDMFKGELIWGQGSYFPLLQYRGTDSPSDAALRDALLALSDAPFYVAMADDDLGARCVGVFTRRINAEYALEKLINQDAAVMELARDDGKAHFSYAEYRDLYDKHSLENCYWIEEHLPNRTEQ